MPSAEERLIHDLRNTASVIRGAAQQLHEDGAALPESSRADLTEMLARRSDMLVRLVGDLAIIHQLGRGDLRVRLQPVDLAEVCRHALADLPVSDRQVTLDVADDAVAIGDPLRITQVLDNLVSNALRYGGQQITISALRDGEVVRLSVADDGDGVPPDLLRTVFEAYARGPQSERYGGSGLGLAIVQELCAALDGSVAYDADTGTRFTVTLPGVPLLESEDPTVAGSHAMLLWDDDDRLVERILSFTFGGLARGEAVVVAARTAHLREARTALHAAGVEVDRLLATGQLVPLDAEVLHGHFSEGALDEAAFQGLLGVVLDRVAGRWAGVRAFSEVMGMFWAQGDEAFALEMERLWTASVERLAITSLCAVRHGGSGGIEERSGRLRDVHDSVGAA